jgi:aspartyl-tRNA(Asn)/glutamyl-tRNA(Gln) amidotransferase subunit C
VNVLELFAVKINLQRGIYMTEHLTTHDVEDIAAYVKIAMTPDEIAAMTTDLNNIIDTLEPIRQYDLDGVEPTFHPIGALVNVMCEDSPAPSFTQEVALENAPKQQDGAFLIPSILGDGGDR